MACERAAVLLILDGFGHRTEGEDNAILRARTPNLDALREHYAAGTIDASERMVGLPRGQFGNSEVGHLNIGAGRIVPQDITRVDEAIESGQLAANPVLTQLFSQARAATLHVIGLLSEGGVHSHATHFYAVLDAARAQGVSAIEVHAFLDGRDTPPQSAQSEIDRLDAYCQAHAQVRFASLCGRFYAMDRDNRWDRVQAAYDMLFGATPFQAASASEALAAAYARGETDEFVQPTRLHPGCLKDGDAVLFMNFRADRARELTRALTEQDFNDFERAQTAQIHFASLTSYGQAYPQTVLFAPQSLNDTLGQFLSEQGVRQLRIAETEKYPHVTYFFNGGREEPFALEERILVPSPQVKTYDLQPQMNAPIVADHIVDYLIHQKTDVIICNFANGDMVGHTGNLEAAIAAVEALDECVGRIVKAAQTHHAEVIITADHGNCEQMFDAAHHQHHTQHTVNPVPFIYVGRPARIAPGGALKDIAPSLLAILGLTPPLAMQGRNLIEWT